MLNFKQEIEFSSTFSQLATYLHDRGWAYATGGNISLRFPWKDTFQISILDNFPHKTIFLKENPYTYLTNHALVLSASGTSMSEIAKDPVQHVVLCVFHTNYIELYAPLEGILPTSEWRTHFAVHHALKKKSIDSHILVHAHIPSLIALSHIKVNVFRGERKINRLLFSLLPELIIRLPEGISILSFALPGSEKLANTTAHTMLTSPICLWQNHGIVIRGKSVEDITERLDLLDHAVHIYMQINHMRLNPHLLSYRTIRKLKNIFSHYPH
ncbi:MAG: class II aldolase/adducin family protein [Bacteroidales bacterium]|nr:class II aldolase/adducin family protein [Bacteroidales bacterium]